MQFNFAILRAPSESIVNGLSQHQSDEKPNYKKALFQHKKYSETLEKLGLKTCICDAKEEFSDGCFVEDTHLVLPEVTMRLNPGAPSRAQEPESLSEFFPRDRSYRCIPSDLKIDGGDILVSGKKIYVGLSNRTQKSSADFLRMELKKYNYDVISVPVPEGLHLKSGVTLVCSNIFVIQKPFESILKEIFEYKTYFVVPENEDFAANVLPLNGEIIIPTQCPKTKEFILQYYPEDKIHQVDTTEFRKVDGALTCLSIPMKI